MIFEVGDLVPVTSSLTENDGTANLVVVDPSGSATTIPGITFSTGYNTTFRATLAGRHTVKWTTVNNVVQDVFDVRGVLTSIISTEDAFDFMRLDMTRNSGEVEKVQALVETASDLIYDVTGPLTAQTYVEWFDGGTGTYVMMHSPVKSVTTVFEYAGLSQFQLTEQPLGGQMNAYAFTVDYTTGQITRRTFGGQAAMFPEGAKNVVVTYIGGLSPIPSSIQMACRELVKHLYTATQVPIGRTRVNVTDEGMTPGITYAVPNFVMDMIPLRYRRPPGIA